MVALFGDVSMDRLSILPVEIIKLIIERLEYASEVNALAQTCRHLSDIATCPYLYPQYATRCSPQGFDRLVGNGNVESLRRLVSNGADLDRFFVYSQGYPARDRRSPIAVAASKGFTEILQVFRDICGPELVESTDLDYAIRKGDVEVLKLFVHGDAPIDTRDELFEYAACCGHVASVKCMVEAGVDVNSVNEFLTPLMMAARGSRLDTIKFLLEAGADPNLSANEEPIIGITTTTLYYAAIARVPGSDASQPEAIVRCLLDHGARLVGPGESETLALARLVFRGAESMAKLIMDRSDFEARLASSTKEERGSLLCVAVAIGDEKLTRRLLEIGCPPIGDKTWPAIQEASKRGRSEIVKLLLDRAMEEPDTDMEDLYTLVIASAVFGNQIPTLVTILDHGKGSAIQGVAVEVIAQTLFATNTMLRSEEISSIFLGRGILDFVTETKKIHSLLREAINCDNYTFAIEVMRHFDMGPSTFLPDTKGTIFELAAEYGPMKGFARIVSLGISIHPDDKTCQSAFFRAAKGLHAEIIEYFLDHGFSVNSSHTICLGSTPSLTEPLIIRVARTKLMSPDDERRALLTLRLLLERGVEIDKCNSKGRTALAEATRMEHVDCAKALLIGGANPFHKTEHGKTPLEMAINHDQVELVKEFLDVAAARGYRHDDFLSLIPSPNIKPVVWGGRLFPSSSTPTPWETNQPDDEEEIDISATDILGNEKRNELQNEDDLFHYPAYWYRFFIIKEMRRYHWRKMYPISEDTK